DLIDGGARVAGDGVGHRLDADRGIAADRHIADHDLPRFAAMNIAIGADAHQPPPLWRSAISCGSSEIPTASPDSLPAKPIGEPSRSISMALAFAVVSVRPTMFGTW